MVQTQIILAGNQQERLDQADKIIDKALGQPGTRKKGHPDLFTLQNGSSLGISQVRLLQKQLALKPYSARMKIALISQAEKLTIPAQNALLKTLEEPPAHTLIILLAPKKEALLPTIISRCQIIQLTQKPETEIEAKDFNSQASLLTNILGSGVGERLRLAEKFRERQKALELTHNLLFLWRNLLLIKGKVGLGKVDRKLKTLNLSQIKTAIEKTEIIRKMLEANVNPRLGIESLFLAFPNLPK